MVAEHLVEDVAQAAAAAAEIEAARGTAATILERGVAEAVVGRALLIVLQDVVGLVQILEPAFRCLVARIAVRVVFHGELAIRFFQCVRRGISSDLQGRIVILLRHLFLIGGISASRTGQADPS